MPAAVARHRADARAGHPVLTHRFLCPVSQLAQLRGELAPGEPWRRGLIADTGPDGLAAALAEIAADPRLVLETIEARLPAAELAAVTSHAPPEAKVYVELPLTTPDWNSASREVVSRNMAGKIRCGGTDAALFPTAGQLTDFLLAAATAVMPFKATAGLHHAVRYTDTVTGFEHHGFLNLLLAACRAAGGSAAGEVRAMLLEDDGVVLAAAARQVPPQLAARTRALFVAYGSCSTSEPVEDLAALGLVEVEPA
jgi:hypothetical protein